MMFKDKTPTLVLQEEDCKDNKSSKKITNNAQHYYKLVIIKIPTNKKCLPHYSMTHQILT